MKINLFFIFKLFMLWLVLFTFQRLLFILHYWSDFDGLFTDLLKLPFFSFQLDASITAYFIGIPFIFLILNQLFSKNSFAILSKWSTLFLGVISSLIFSSELIIYEEWRSKLSSKIFIHLSTPTEVFRTAFGEFTLWFVFYLIIQIVVFYYLFKVLFSKFYENNRQETSTIKLLIGFIVSSFLLIIIGRGGLQPIPITKTNAYFSNAQILNDVSVNSTWNFIDMTMDFIKADSEKYFNSMSASESNKIVENLYNFEPIDSIRIFNSKQPDIIFITLEGWSQQLIECMGGKKGITPNFDKLASEGVLFTEIYATSGTSETGHSSIFSGYPTIPKISISNESSKSRNLPSLIKSLNNYNSAYYFGGSLDYGNIKSYLTEIGFEKIVDENNLPELSPKGYLGYHDGAMLPYFLSEIQKEKSPFIYGLFTQSTHSPYDMPEPMMDEYPNSKYAASLHYADKEIKKFTDALQKLPNFKNTIVVFISDHGKTNFVNNKSGLEDEFYHIPVLFWGGGLKNGFKGYKNTKIGSQIDIVKTLLNQLNIKTDNYKWSKDLFNPNVKEWAMFSSTFSYGIKTKQGYVNYIIKENIIESETYLDTINMKTNLKKCKAFNESVYREYKKL